MTAAAAEVLTSGDLVGEGSAAVESLHGIGAALSGLVPETMSSQERRDLLAAIERAYGVLAAARGRVLAVAERAEDWRASGDRSAAAWHGRASRVGAAQARSHVRQARAVEQMPLVAAAVETGAVTAAHLDVLARLADGADDAARGVLAAPQMQGELVTIAQRQDPETFSRTVRRRLAENDPDELDRTFEGQRAQRYLHLSTTATGLRLQAQLDPFAGQVLRQAIEALSPRPAEGDDRSPEQRRADALETMAAAVLGDPGTLSGSAVRPHVSLVMTDESLAAHRQLLATRGGDVVPGWTVPFTPATFEDGAPVPPAVVARVLCDYDVTRVALDAEQMPMDVGRTKRCYDGHLRRAVIVRDGACSWAGCGQHARWCEIHHISWWSRGGETSVENGVLLCKFHHDRVHELDLRLTRHALASGEVAGNGVARVRYEFRHPDGRVFVPDDGRQGRSQVPDGGAQGQRIVTQGGQHGGSRVSDGDRQGPRYGPEGHCSGVRAGPRAPVAAGGARPDR